MTAYTVKLVYRQLVDGEAVRRLMAHEPACRRVWTDALSPRVEVAVDVDADEGDLAGALTSALATVAAVVTVVVDSAEVLSAAEHTERLGGPATVQHANREMTDRL